MSILNHYRQTIDEFTPKEIDRFDSVEVGADESESEGDCKPRKKKEFPSKHCKREFSLNQSNVL